MSGDLGYSGFPVLLNYFTAVPDASYLRDPRASVAFKALFKKDPITREKSLGDLLRLLKEPESVQDEHFLISWVQAYPKLAIDTARGVRLLAHETQARVLLVVGGKSYGRFLKSSVPAWLHGLSDSDRSVAAAARRGLLECFQEPEKVDLRLWVLFPDAIANYVAAVAAETPDSLLDKRYVKPEDALAKHDRVVAGSLLMLVRLIQLSSSGELVLDSETAKQLETVLLLEALWDRLGPTLAPETANTALFRTFLVLLKHLFTAHNNAPSPFIMAIDARSLYKLVSKKFLRLVKIKPGKTLAASILYSSVIVQFWDTLIALTQFPLVAPKDLKIKKSFWELGSSKVRARLLDYLKLGPCNLTPVYFPVVLRFFEVLKTAGLHPEEPFLDFSNSKDASAVLKILGDQLSRLPSVEYKTRAVSCILNVYRTFALSNEDTLALSKAIIYHFYSALSGKPFNDTDKQLQKDALNNVAAFIGEKALLEDLNGAIISASNSEDASVLSSEPFGLSMGVDAILRVHFGLLESTSQHLIESLITSVLEGLAESSIARPTIAFSVLSRFFELKWEKSSLDQPVSEFIETLPTFIETDFVEEPLSLFAAIFDSSYFSKVDQNQLIGDIYAKLDMVAKPEVAKYVLSLAKCGAFTLETAPTEIKQYLLSLLKTPSLSHTESDLVFRFVGDLEVLKNLLSSASEGSHLAFIRQYSKNLPSRQLDVSDARIETAVSRILPSVWGNIASKDAQTFVGNLKVTGLNLLKKSAYDFVLLEVDPDFTAFSAYIRDSFELFPYSELNETVSHAISSTNNDILSISNPLEETIGLVSSSGPYKLQRNIISIGRFLAQLITADFANVDCLMLSGIVGEYIHDYSFLSDDKTDVLEVRAKLAEICSRAASQIDIKEAVLLINGPHYERADFPYSLFGRLSSIVSSDSSNYGFYAARVLKSLILPSADLQTVETLEIDYNKLLRQPLKLAVVVSSFSGVLTKTKRLDRARNVVFSEILGVKPTQILSEGLKWLTLSIGFLNVDAEEAQRDKYEPVPLHRLSMVLTQLEKWLESEEAFDASFVVVRTQMARFFASLIAVGGPFPDRFWEVASGLCVDNLAVVEAESARIELKYFTLKLFVALCRKGHENEGVIDQLIEVTTSHDVQMVEKTLPGQPVSLVHDLVVRVLSQSRISEAVLKQKTESFYRLLSESEFVALQRLGAGFLHRVVLQTQQDFVVEYQLQKSSLGEDAEGLSASLPPQLMNTVSSFHSYIDEELESSPFKVTQYLWSWCLIFDHFKDITYLIRNSYVAQVRDGPMERLLDLIFEHVDVTSPQVLKKLSSTLIENHKLRLSAADNMLQHYSATEGLAGEPLGVEMQFLLLHLYYQAFQFLGSRVQAWFNGLRDRQHKQQIEKFSINYVSPLLIARIFEDVALQKSRLKDDNMTIKANSTTGEIRSVYVIDDQTMEMVIKIPPSYPLSSVSVEGPLRLGVKENQWKAWLLASQRIISLTNGSVMELVELFNKNVNLHFLGFEDCAICYLILHQDHSLPLKTCTTCLNKFHAACLYKWFKSLGASTCPLCRSAFNFRTARD